MENNQKYLPIHSFWNLSNEQKQEVDVDSKKEPMKKFCKFLYAIPMVAALMAHSSCHGDKYMNINTSTVKQLDIPRFMGKWYEIAHIC